MKINVTTFVIEATSPVYTLDNCKLGSDIGEISPEASINQSINNDNDAFGRKKIVAIFFTLPPSTSSSFSCHFYPVVNNHQHQNELGKHVNFSTSPIT
ncbi:hypothetical protein DERP_010322 [Dermatophagoides pteronyssinus]|uniref:Uncharacterized protein n=1 Tax=Dermatophagoides pteronyssinus TaxID=6956 RepID=A0ABQ8IZ46_DERPT|nr:hypothetical protein DERP_010322 [Dermatophagoides pteronyssinus]